MSGVARAFCGDGLCRITGVGGGGSASGSVMITASVGEGGSNRPHDVRTIQDALNQVPEPDGGPQPPLKVDGLCWGKTIAAIRRFQKMGCGFQWPDGRIEPGRRTHQKLQTYFLPPNPYHVSIMYAVLPAALGWIYSARNALREAEWKLRGLPSGSRGLGLAHKYFHLDQLSNGQALSSVDRIRALYNTMETVIGRSTPMTSPGTGYFQEDALENRHFAYTWAGGYTMAGPARGGPPATGAGDGPEPGVRKDTIYICPRRWTSHGLEFYTLVVVHELAHFCGPVGGSADAIEDHGYRRQPAFFQLTPWQAIRTADCYAHFAGEAHLGREAPYR